jgi:hypothetical protein
MTTTVVFFQIGPIALRNASSPSASCLNRRSSAPPPSSWFACVSQPPNSIAATTGPSSAHMILATACINGAIAVRLPQSVSDRMDDKSCTSRPPESDRSIPDAIAIPVRLPDIT